MDELAIFVAIVLGIAALAWLLVGPILTIVLWKRVSRLDDEIRILRLRDRKRPRAEAVTADEPSPAEPLTDIWLADTEEPARPAAAVPKTPKPVASAASFSEPPQLPSEPPRRPAAPREDESFSLEELLAGKWLTWVGALAVVIGMGFFLKYSIDQGWIGPTARVVLGLVTGMVCFAAGAFAMLRNYRFLSQGLVGAALGILYFSLFAGYRFYDGLIPQPIAFGGMILVTAAALAYSAYFNALATAVLGLLGGFLTPIMLGRGEDAQLALFSYIFILDAGVLGVATFRRWPSLNLLALAGTALMWVGWLDRFFDPETNLALTVALMTAFFLLFALLGIWHNVIRRVPAEAGDFALILATPVLYFIGLYAVTEEHYAAFHGLMAVALAGTYLALGLFALSRNPAGRNVIVALGGIAASFLTVAIPLQLTGHWIVIAWAAESVLLFELGLRFDERRLRMAGLALLAVVQLTLLYYAGATIAEPERFTTRFTAIDPFVREGVIDEFSRGSSFPLAEASPSWTDIFNGRSFSFLASALAFAVIAWEYRRRSRLLETAEPDLETTPEPVPNQLTGWLIAAIPLTLLGMFLVETFALSARFDWITPSLLSAFAAGAALAGLALALLAVSVGPKWLQQVALGVFGLAALFLVINTLGTLAGWRSDWIHLTQAAAGSDHWRLPLFNPRGAGFLITLASATAAAFLLRGIAEPLGARRFASSDAPLDAAAILGGFAHLTAIALLTVEVYAQGVIRDWGTGTALAITLVWTAYAIALLVVGIYYRSATVRILSLSLFLMTTAKVFLYDVWKLDATIRTFAFIGLGVSLLMVSFLYRRFRDRIRAWISPTAAAVLALAVISPSQPAVADEPAVPAARLMQAFPQRWPLEIDEAAPAPASNALRKIPLPLTLYAHAKPDLGDIRLLAGENPAEAVEIPYLLLAPSDSETIAERQARLLNLSQRGGATEFLLDAGDLAEPVDRLRIEVASAEKNFERQVIIEGANSDDPDEWNQLSDEGYLLDVTRPGHRFRVDTVTFPQSRFRFYRVRIPNAEQPPLDITGAKLVDRRKVRMPRREIETPFRTEHDPSKRETHVILDLPSERLPVVGVTLDIHHDGNFYRPATVAAKPTDDPKVDWSTVAGGSLFRIHREELRAEQTKLEFSATPAGLVRITIANGDDRPLEIAGATVLVAEKFLIVEARRLPRPGPTVALYAGNREVSSPEYDLARTLGEVNPAQLDPLPAADVEPNPFYTGPEFASRPWSEEHRWTLWAITLAVIVVLGTLTVLLLRRAATLPPNEA